MVRGPFFCVVVCYIYWFVDAIAPEQISALQTGRYHARTALKADQFK